MGFRKRVLNFANRALDPLSLTLRRTTTSWDGQFAEWLEESKASGLDPNEIGDSKWGSDLLTEGLERHYLPFLTRDSVVLELGPGSGRLSRHVIGRCRHLIVVDSSKYVCDWITEYLKGKGSYEVHRIDSCDFPGVADASIDCVLAHGVFEHLDGDEVYWFLKDCFRVLKPSGVVAFNYDTLLSDEAVRTLHDFSSPTRRCVFRLHHPAELESIARLAGFEQFENFDSGTRISFVRLTR